MMFEPKLTLCPMPHRAGVAGTGTKGCHRCGAEGHFYRQCKAPFLAVLPTFAAFKSKPKPKSKPGNAPGCQFCGKHNHVMQDCRNYKRAMGKPQVCRDLGGSSFWAAPQSSGFIPIQPAMLQPAPPPPRVNPLGRGAFFESFSPPQVTHATLALSLSVLQDN